MTIVITVDALRERVASNVIKSGHQEMAAQNKCRFLFIHQKRLLQVIHPRRQFTVTSSKWTSSSALYKECHSESMCHKAKLESGSTSSGVCRVAAIALRTMHLIIAVVSRVTGCATLCAHKLPSAALGCVSKSLTPEATPRVRNVGSNMKFYIAGFKRLGQSS
ncbi:uncharacterized protein [Dermacentor albipictus]|uniref:uncharacterized protein isoform X1 n=1 Tax=Dermacentor albipictus TaxID=60249 RepID=UPI0038FC36FD